MFAGDHLTVLSVDGASNLDSVVESLLRLPAQDVVVVVLGDGALASLASHHGELFARLALHVRGGGTYVVDRRAGDRQAVTGLGSDNPDIARFIKSIDVSEELTVVTKRGRHALTLREHQVADVLPERESALEVSILEVRPAGRLELHLEDSSYGPSRAGRVASGARLSRDDRAALRRCHSEHRRDAPPHRRHRPTRVVPVATREDAATSALRRRSPVVCPPREAGSRGGAEGRLLLRRLPLQRPLRAPHHRGPVPAVGLGPGPTRHPWHQGALPHQPCPRGGRHARASALHRVRHPQLPLGLVGPTGAAAQRGGCLADVAQQVALLRPPRHPGDVGAG